MKSSPYLDLLKMTLTDYHRVEYGEYRTLDFNTYRPSWKVKVLLIMDRILNKVDLKLFRRFVPNQNDRYNGKDRPSYAETMIGIKRLNNIEYCLNQVIGDGVPGDMIETGVWRGGATIFMRAVLKELGVVDRTVWVADSFHGLPKPNAQKYAKDKGDKHYTNKALFISLDQVKRNFRKYNLLDDQVKFLKGWFKDTLPKAPIDKLALLRLDGDMYESTLDALTHLYPKLSVGGYVIIDDWGAVKACQQAVLDYRKANNISEDIIEIDWTGVYWRKEN